MTTQVAKKPPYKQSVGAQYICFATEGAEQGEFTKQYKPEVEKTETVKTVTITEASESTPIYGSGKIYDTDENTSGMEISVEVIAFVAKTRAEMRGDTVTEKGLIKKGAVKNGKPFFAYGKVVKMSGSFDIFEWYPKCKLVSNTDDTKTKEASFSEQNDTYTITAMPYNDDGDICVTYDPTVKIIEGMCEDIFFAKPILDDADLVNSPAVQSAEPILNGADLVNSPAVQSAEPILNGADLVNSPAVQSAEPILNGADNEAPVVAAKAKAAVK